MITKEFVVKIVNTIRSTGQVIIKKNDLEFHRIPIQFLKYIIVDSTSDVRIVEIANRYKIYKK